ncbi:hypothetical protein [Teichococcus vastitatis]|uniref:hypothetical protein n=1 Tax=Teichococcus vastitatis TaxID=2307076 RepID=UPI000E74BDE7|nr:hypothetical protein [Pseudoroseomonas vastitatis]
MLRRAKYLKLTKLAVESFKARAYRGNRLPFDARFPGREHDSYTPIEALLTVIQFSLEEAFAMNPVKAVEIVQALPVALLSRWSEIGDYVERARIGDSSSVELLCGRLQPDGMTPPIPFCGTLADVAEQRKLGVWQGVITSASRTAVVLDRRAVYTKVELPADFWAVAPTI